MFFFPPPTPPAFIVLAWKRRRNASSAPDSSLLDLLQEQRGAEAASGSLSSPEEEAEEDGAKKDRRGLKRGLGGEGLLKKKREIKKIRPSLQKLSFISNLLRSGKEKTPCGRMHQQRPPFLSLYPPFLSLSLSLFSLFLQLPRAVPASVPSRDQLMAFIWRERVRGEREGERE